MADIRAKWRGYAGLPEEAEVTGVPAYAFDKDSEKGMDPEMLERVRLLAEKFQQQTKKPLRVRWGFRSKPLQAKMRADFEAGRSPGPVATAEGSRHPKGLAVDFYSEDLPTIRKLASSVGLHAPVKGDPIHYEMMPAAKKTAKAAKVAATLESEESKIRDKWRKFAETDTSTEVAPVSAGVVPERIVGEDPTAVLPAEFAEQSLLYPDKVEYGKAIPQPTDPANVAMAKELEAGEEGGLQPVTWGAPENIAAILASFGLTGLVQGGVKAGATQLARAIPGVAGAEIGGGAASSVAGDLPPYAALPVELGAAVLGGNIAAKGAGILHPRTIRDTLRRTPRMPGPTHEAGVTEMLRRLGGGEKFDDALLAMAKEYGTTPETAAKTLQTIMKAPSAAPPVIQLQQRLHELRTEETKLNSWVGAVQEYLDDAAKTMGKLGEKAKSTVVAGGYKIPGAPAAVQAVMEARNTMRFWGPRMGPKMARLNQVKNLTKEYFKLLNPQVAQEEAVRLNSISQEVQRAAVTGGRVRSVDELAFQGLSEGGNIRNAKEFAAQAGIKSSIKRGQTTFPEELYEAFIDPRIPSIAKDLKVRDRLKSFNVVARRFTGETNNVTNDYMEALNVNQSNKYDVRQVLTNIFKKAGLGPDVKKSLKVTQKELGPVFDEYMDRLLKMKAEGKTISKATVQDVAGDLLKKRDMVIKSLGARHPNVRIKAAAEDKTWAINMLKPGEKEIVAEIRKYLDHSKRRMMDKGMEVLKDKTYVPYIFQKGGYGKHDTAWEVYPKSAWLYGNKDRIPDFVEFMPRLPGSEDWFPLAYQSLHSYAGSLEHKLAFNAFRQKWVPRVDNWQTTKGTQAHQAKIWLSNFLTRNLSKEVAGAWDDGINKAVNLEYFKDIGFSASVALLHLGKLPQTWYWHGTVPTAKGTWSFLKALQQMSTGKGGTESDILKRFLKGGQLSRVLLQAKGGGGILEPGPFQKVMSGTGEVVMSPTKAIEYLDNGINMFAAMHRGISGGADANTIRNLMYDTMQLLNFRGFSAPGFMTRGGVSRALTQFQMTPFKLIENKAQLLHRGLTGKKDVLGQHEFWKLMRFFTFVGGAYKLGQEAGYDLSRHLVHPPMIELNIPALVEDASKQDWDTFMRRVHHAEFRPPPIFQYASKLSGYGAKRLVKDWIGYPGPLGKLWGRKPQKYEDRLDYNLGLPVAGHDEATWYKKDKAELRREKAERKRGPSTTEQGLEHLIKALQMDAEDVLP